MPFTTSGLHHVTAIARRPQSNIDFYVRVLGLRLVKRTVNYDDPETYHFYFGDAVGSPGTLLTFFPWPGAGPGTRGAGETVAVALRTQAAALDGWRARLAAHGLACSTHERFGAEVVAFADPDGTPIELVAVDADPPTPAPWPASSVPEPMAVRGVLAVTITSPRIDDTTALLHGAFGLGVEAESLQDGTLRRRLAAGTGAGRTFVDVLEAPEPLAARWGSGSIHHVAFRAADEPDQAAARSALLSAGLAVTKVKDRRYFRSIYATEPGGAIVEVATDGPGFTVDEPADELGLGLKLPPWLEQERATLRGRLPVTASPEYADRWSNG